MRCPTLPLLLLLAVVQASLLSATAQAVSNIPCDVKFATQYNAIKTKLSACETATSIVLAPPLSPNQKAAVCTACSDLVVMMQNDNFPRCYVWTSGTQMNLRRFMRNLFGSCGNGANAAADDTDAGSDSQIDATAAPTTKSPAAATGKPAGTLPPLPPPPPPPPTGDANASQTANATAPPGVSIGVVLGIVAGALVIVLVLVFFVVRYRRQRKSHHKLKHHRDASSSSSDKLHASAILDSSTGHASSTASPSQPHLHDPHAFAFARVADTSNSNSNDDHHQSLSMGRSTYTTLLPPPPATMTNNLWDDAVIVAARIPTDKIVRTVLLARGGFGEVYRGVYNHRSVAIKQLLPEHRKDLGEIHAFLYEIKLLASLEHERIVTFVGVAWDALTDVCAVSEFMDGGDLRGLMVQFEKRQRRRGFDADKIRIAMHVAHALTYLHSLQPAIVHRDLKSKNILLDSAWNAKLADFGVSRERSETKSHMTAGVGTSLWMAPEVMLGERYDDKADMFSFGIVLSELDSHAVPYAHVKETTSGRRIPDSAVLQMVSLGRLQVQFTAVEDGSIAEMVALGLACVAVRPQDRPSAADALYTLHNILKSMFCVL